MLNSNFDPLDHSGLITGRSFQFSTKGLTKCQLVIRKPVRGATLSNWNAKPQPRPPVLWIVYNLPYLWLPPASQHHPPGLSSHPQYEINSLHIGMILYKLNLLTLPHAHCMLFSICHAPGLELGARSATNPFRSLNYSLSHFHSRGSSSFFIFVILRIS